MVLRDAAGCLPIHSCSLAMEWKRMRDASLIHGHSPRRCGMAGTDFKCEVRSFKNNALLKEGRAQTVRDGFVVKEKEGESSGPGFPLLGRPLRRFKPWAEGQGIYANPDLHAAWGGFSVRLPARRPGAPGSRSRPGRSERRGLTPGWMRQVGCSTNRVGCLYSRGAKTGQGYFLRVITKRSRRP